MKELDISYPRMDSSKRKDLKKARIALQRER